MLVPIIVGGIFLTASLLFLLFWFYPRSIKKSENYDSWLFDISTDNLPQPEIINPLEPVTLAEPNMSLPIYSVPSIRGAWYTTGKDTRKLSEYISELASTYKTIQDAAHTTIEKFNTRFNLLKHQETQLSLRVMHTQKYLRPFRKELHFLSASQTLVDKNAIEISLPATPYLIDMEKFKTSTSVFYRNTGIAATRMIKHNGGGAANSKNMAIMAVAMLTMIVRGKSNVSALKRAAESAYGEVSNYSKELKMKIEMLQKNDDGFHVIQSNALKQSELELIDLIDKVRLIPTHTTTLENMDEIDRENIKELYNLYLRSVRLYQTSNPLKKI